MSLPVFQQLPEGASLLFIRLRNLGEAVLDTANLRALHRFRPDLKITTLVEAPYTDLYAADPDIAALPLTRDAQHQRSSFASRLAILREIRQRKFTAVVNLHGGPTSAQLTLASGARYRIGAAHFRPSLAYNVRVPPAEEILGRDHLHTVESQFGWFKWLGLPGETPAGTRLLVAAEHQQNAAEKLRGVGIEPGQFYAVLAPTNEFYTKRWLPERFAAIAEELKRRGYQIVLTGAPTHEQRLQLEQVQQATSERLPSLSSLRIGELVAVIAGARLFIGNDSGPAHIAAAVQTPVVVLFGPASAERWRPWAERAVLVQNDFACNPCAMYTCTAFAEPECIRSISVAQVLSAVDRVLR